MEFIKANNGDRYYIRNSEGNTIAYIEKMYMGTHGHWRGWDHYVLDLGRKEFICGRAFWYFGIENTPEWFRNLQAAKEYYGGVA